MAALLQSAAPVLHGSPGFHPGLLCGAPLGRVDRVDEALRTGIPEVLGFPVGQVWILC